MVIGQIATEPNCMQMNCFFQLCNIITDRGRNIMIYGEQKIELPAQCRARSIHTETGAEIIRNDYNGPRYWDAVWGYQHQILYLPVVSDGKQSLLENSTGMAIITLHALPIPAVCGCRAFYLRRDQDHDGTSNCRR